MHIPITSACSKDVVVITDIARYIGVDNITNEAQHITERTGFGYLTHRDIGSIRVFKGLVSSVNVFFVSVHNSWPARGTLRCVFKWYLRLLEQDHLRIQRQIEVIIGNGGVEK